MMNSSKILNGRKAMAVSILALGVSGAAFAEIAEAQECAFTMSGSTMLLNGSCETTSSIIIPDGMTLDCQGHWITGVEDNAGDWVGGVVENGGTVASVKNCAITVENLASACKGGDDRLRGILFDGASGFVQDNEILNINKGASGCQEGNGIEVRNAPFDGTHPGTVMVDVTNNKVFDYQKTGIVGNGDVDISIHANQVGASATQENLAANSIQVGFGALGSITRNNIDGNQWMGTSYTAATAVLLFSADSGGFSVDANNIRGNSDVGIYVLSDNVFVDNNKVFDQGADHPNSCCDIGIGLWGSDSFAGNNKVRGFDIPVSGAEFDGTKVIPDPGDQ